MMCDVSIVHTGEASEWAEYLQQILASSCNFADGSVMLCDVNEDVCLHNHEQFSSSKCIMLLLSAALLDMQQEPDVLDIFRNILQPPHKVVAFLCGVSEWQVSNYFEHWEYWRKLSSEDDPSVYVSAVLECINDGSVSQHQLQNEYEIELEKHMEQFSISEIPAPSPDETDEHQINGDDVCASELTSDVAEPQENQNFLTVQPDRIICGERANIYVIMVEKLRDEGSLEVEFDSQHSRPQRIPASLFNECIVTVQSPAMPAGKASLTLFQNESVVCSTTVTYYTEMEEICRCLEKASDPMQFMCQAFDITSKVPESLDDLLANSVKERMPLNGFQVFGISQIADNTAANHRDVELPTLLHFSAKYGFKKLTSLLLRCPGALQAYSVMNKDGDYPNQLAEKSGFSDIRQFMDDYVESVDLEKTHMEDQNTTGTDDIYEDMLTASQKFVSDFANEDVYESMVKPNPEMGDDSNECTLKDSDPEALLIEILKGQPSWQSLECDPMNGGFPEMDDDDYHDMGLNPDIYGEIEEEDPYNPCCPDQIYDTVETHLFPDVANRPPAPIPRPANQPEPEENTNYISKVFCVKEPVYSLSQRPERDSSLAPVRLVRDRNMSTHHDPYAGMKTPGQRQLISLQERVKVGELTVEEAVQEFKAWQINQDKRLRSLRFQQDNLQRLRDSITRRGRGKGTNELMITSPMQTNVQWESVNVNCSVYEPTPRSVAPPPTAGRPLQRGSWQTGSTSSTSSSGSHRLSVQSTVSNSSGVEAECEEPPDIPLPPLPRFVADTPPVVPPPRVPPRIIERNTESLNERYVSSPSRPVPQTPAQRPMPPPPIPRRTW